MPSGDEQDTFGNMLSDMGFRGDVYAGELLFAGWFEDELSPSERAAAREQFFDYTGLDIQDFDWDSWREWYGEAA